MKIGLISDTHVPLGRPRLPFEDPAQFKDRELPPEIARAFAGVDLILHAGDIFSADCLDQLERIAPVMAVEYPPSDIEGDPRVEMRRRVIEIKAGPVSGGDSPWREQSRRSYTIGLTHELIITDTGWEVMPGAIAARFAQERSLPAILEDLFGKALDIVVFGDTHHALVEEHQGVLFVNPGSPTLPRQQKRLGSVAILELSAAGRQARIVELADFSE